MPAQTARCACTSSAPVSPKDSRTRVSASAARQVGGVELGVVARIADGRRVQPGMLVGEAPVRVGDGLERVAPGTPDHRRAQLVAEQPDRVEREVAQQPVEPVDMRIQRLAADSETRPPAPPG